MNHLSRNNRAGHVTRVEFRLPGAYDSTLAGFRNNVHIIFGCDHRGLNLKQSLLTFAAGRGHECEDAGSYDATPVDYPDIACVVGEAVACRRADFGVLVCSSGNGMCIAANKVSGVRAALCHNVLTAAMARCHNDANVLCLGASVVEPGAGQAILETFLSTQFEGGRHAARLDKIKALEGRKVRGCLD